MSEEFPPELPDIIYCRALRSGGGKQISGVREDSPLIKQYENTRMAYTKYTRTPQPLPHIEGLKLSIELLEYHNQWRKGVIETPMVKPKELGDAIDTLIKASQAYAALMKGKEDN